MTLVKGLGLATIFVVGLLAAAVSAVIATRVVWGDIGVVVFFVLLIAPPLSALLSLYIAFKLLPRDGLPRPMAFVISSAVLGALLGPCVIPVMAWII